MSNTFISQVFVVFMFGVLMLSSSAVAADGCSQLPSNVDATTLVGKCADEARKVPSFKALSHDGTTRSEKDLVGHPTVLWFFPVAGTPG